MQKFDLLHILKFSKGHYDKAVLSDESNLCEVLQKCLEEDGYPHLKGKIAIRQILLSRLQNFSTKKDLASLLINEIHPQKDYIVMSICGRDAEYEENVKIWDLDIQTIKFVLGELRYMNFEYLGITGDELCAVKSIDFPTYFEEYENI